MNRAFFTSVRLSGIQEKKQGSGAFFFEIRKPLNETGATFKGVVNAFDEPWNKIQRLLNLWGCLDGALANIECELVPYVQGGNTLLSYKLLAMEIIGEPPKATKGPNGPKVHKEEAKAPVDKEKLVTIKKEEEPEEEKPLTFAEKLRTNPFG